MRSVRIVALSIRGERSSPSCSSSARRSVRVLAIDQGTSATKAVVFGDDGETVASVEVAVTPRAVRGRRRRAGPRAIVGLGLPLGPPGGGGVRAAAWCGRRLRQPGRDRAGLGSRHWHPLSTAISWQDRRAAAICADLAPHAEQLTRTTGLPLDPYFAAPKMTWLRRNVTGKGVVTTSDAWLVHRLTGAFVTDATTASRTLLLDLERRTWSEQACALFGLEPGGPPRRRRQRTGDRPDRRLRSEPDADRAVRRPAGGAGGAALPGAGEVEVHLRDRRLPARQRRCSALHVVRRPGRLGGLATRRGRRLLHRRSGLCRRRRRRRGCAAGASSAGPRISTPWRAPCATAEA